MVLCPKLAIDFPKSGASRAERTRLHAQLWLPIYELVCAHPAVTYVIYYQKLACFLKQLIQVNPHLTYHIPWIPMKYKIYWDFPF